MRARASMLGHPIHAILIVFPMGLLGMAVIFDVIHLFSAGSWSVAATYMIGAGVITGLVAAGFGLVDWTAIPSGTPAKSIGRWHAITNVMVVLAFALAWWLRRTSPGQPSTDCVALEIAAFGLAGIGGWLGGELVHRFGVGVEPGASVHARRPSAASPGVEQPAVTIR